MGCGVVVSVCKRKECAQGRDRTSDTRIFSPLLYQLSYLGVQNRAHWLPWRTNNDKSSRVFKGLKAEEHRVSCPLESPKSALCGYPGGGRIIDRLSFCLRLGSRGAALTEAPAPSAPVKRCAGTASVPTVEAIGRRGTELSKGTS